MIDSRMRRPVLSAALRASVGSRARRGSNFRPLLPKYNATPVCNQELTEYHELKHSRKMFLDNVVRTMATETSARNPFVIAKAI
jgi:hypothetical protein